MGWSGHFSAQLENLATAAGKQKGLAEKAPAGLTLLERLGCTLEDSENFSEEWKLTVVTGTKLSTTYLLNIINISIILMCTSASSSAISGLSLSLC